jgi:hypothetical protein
MPTSATAEPVAHLIDTGRGSAPSRAAGEFLVFGKRLAKVP